jgi:hypothetical protein
MAIIDVFLACDTAIRNGTLIRRASRRDKEFHFQDWFGSRLEELGVAYDAPGRNSYPDFRLVEGAEGYEVKGLAFPGRKADFDSNSQTPSGFHNGRTIFYLFGRYPKDPDEDQYPVIDMVLCHGDFLNADHEYVHSNKHVKAFGSYGDIKIRDRKMYVVPTPFALTVGTMAQRTLILPQEGSKPQRGPGSPLHGLQGQRDRGAGREHEGPTGGVGARRLGRWRHRRSVLILGLLCRFSMRAYALRQTAGDRSVPSAAPESHSGNIPPKCPQLRRPGTMRHSVGGHKAKSG